MDGQLLSLCEALMSANNTDRQNAENILQTEWITNSPHTLLPSLTQLIFSCELPQIRSFATVLFKRIALKNNSDSSNSIYCSIGSDSRQFCETHLIQSLHNETVPEIRRKICYCVADLYRHLLEKGGAWPELIQSFFILTKSTRQDLRESAYLILSNNPDVLSSISDIEKKQFFLLGLGDDALEVRVNAIKGYSHLFDNPAVCAYLEDLEENLELYNDIIPILLDRLAPMILQPQVLEKTLDVLAALTEFAQNHFKMFKPIISNIVNFTTTIMKDSNIDTSLQQAVLELSLTLMDQSPSMIKKLSSFASDVIPILMEWLSEVDDDQDWYTTDEIDDEDNNTNAVYAEQSLDRIAISLSGKTVLPIAFTLIPQMLSSPKWEHRHAALFTISSIAEGCEKIMKVELDKILNLILPHFKDPHPRVRHSTCHAIGQLCTDFAPNIQARYHSIIVPNLISILDDFQFPRLQAHAAAALVNFCDEARERQVAPYLDTLIRKLIDLLSSPKTYVQEQVLTTLATLADSAQTEFVKYYDMIMPILITIMRNAVEKERRVLRARAIECSSLVALSVGKTIFHPHHQEIMMLYRDIQQSVIDQDDPIGSYLLTAWGRICKTLESDFYPFLDFVMQPLLITAQSQPEVLQIETEEDVAKCPPEEGWAIFGSEGKRYALRATSNEDKYTAISLLMTYARDTGSNFAPYLEKSWLIVFSSFNYFLNDDVRMTAFACIPYLLGCMIKSAFSQEIICEMWIKVVNSLIDAAQKEPEQFVKPHIFTTLQECIEILGPTYYNETTILAINGELNTQMIDHQKRTLQFNERKRDPEFDAEDEENLMLEEDEETLMGSISRLFHELFKTYTQSYLPFFEILIPTLNSLIREDNPQILPSIETKQFVIGVWDDAIEFCGDGAWKYSSHFGSLLGKSINDRNPDIRQSACYGVGVSALFPVYSPFYQACLPLLFKVVEEKDSKEGDNILATENAISAIGKICHYGQVDDSCREAWIQMLPIIEDELECEHVYSYFLELCETGKCNNIPKITEIVSTVLTAQLVNEQLETRLVSLLRQIVNQCDQTAKTTLWSSLSSEAQRLITERNWI